MAGAAIVALGGWQVYRLARPARPSPAAGPDNSTNSRVRRGAAVAVDVAP